MALDSRVYGVATGAFADHAVTTADRIAPAPSTVDATSAAGLPVASVTALQAIGAAELTGSARVRVIGASGGVGTLAVQLAVARGARVTAVCSGRNAELVRGLGAEHVVDYTSGGLEGLAGPYDAIIDAAAAPPFRRRRELLSRKGTYVIIGATAGGRLVGPLGPILRAKLSFALGRRRARFFIASVRCGRHSSTRGVAVNVSTLTRPLDPIVQAQAHRHPRRVPGAPRARPVDRLGRRPWPPRPGWSR